ncbi:MAG: hypothetical protein Q9175_000652 [Cornicularia normoerica]
MVKDNETVIEYVVFDPDHDAALTQNREFNEQVNMTAGELEEWLRRTIIEILEKKPKKDPSKHEEDDFGHMGKVVSYCKRHLAQEEKAKRDIDSKSYKSLKNSRKADRKKAAAVVQADGRGMILYWRETQLFQTVSRLQPRILTVSISINLMPSV